MKTEGPIYNQPKPNDYSGILNLYLRCPKKNEVSPNFFAADYCNKRNYVIDFLGWEDDDRENVKTTATELVDVYCTSNAYSILEDSTEVFEAFMKKYLSNIKYATNYLKNQDNDEEYVKVTATNLVKAYCTSESYSILEDSTQVFQAFMEEYFCNLKVIADVLNRTLNQGVTK